MKNIKDNLINTFEFLKDTKAYFRAVLLMHGLVLFILIPTLASMVRFILRRGSIDYLSTDTIPAILLHHPGVLLALISVLFLILLCVFFEFSFLLISMYFIKKKQPVGIKQLLQMTLIQMKKIRPSTFFFFLFYFFMLVPFAGLNFNSDLLSKIKIPSFIMDFIFTNRRIVVTAAVLVYLILLYLSIRFIFALPEMVLRDSPFRQAIKDSWGVTKRRFFAILGRFIFIGGTLLLLSSLGSFIVLMLQRFVESHLPNYALVSAVITMTLLQGNLLLNIVLSTVGSFFVIIDFMDDEGFLPQLPEWFYQEEVVEKRQWTIVTLTAVIAIALIFGIGVGAYNTHYLTSESLKKPETFSHRGVSENNGVQNTLSSLKKTAKLRPDYIEMDVQETKDKQFVVYHDFNLKDLTGIDKTPGEMTLKELQTVNISENGHEASIASFDDYLESAHELNQKLLIEIKTQETSVEKINGIVTRFLGKYQQEIIRHKDILQSLNYQVVEKIKTEVPDLTVGYILPFNIVGPPKSSADFLTMEYSTINRNFIDAAHDDNKKVLVWTVNDEESITRMMFYGADGIITNNLKTLNQTVKKDTDGIQYSDQLMHFVIGVG